MIKNKGGLVEKNKGREKRNIIFLLKESTRKINFKIIIISQTKKLLCLIM